MATPSESNDILLTTLDTRNILGNTKYKWDNGIINQTYDGKKYWRKYHENGLIGLYGYCINKKYEKICILFNGNDELDGIQERKNGKAHGLTILYNKNGRIIEKKKYADDVLIKDYMNID